MYELHGCENRCRPEDSSVTASSGRSDCRSSAADVQNLSLVCFSVTDTFVYNVR